MYRSIYRRWYSIRIIVLTVFVIVTIHRSFIERRTNSRVWDNTYHTVSAFYVMNPTLIQRQPQQQQRYQQRDHIGTVSIVPATLRLQEQSTYTAITKHSSSRISYNNRINRKRNMMQLYFMNWFGFGNTNTPKEGENNESRVQQGDDGSTMSSSSMIASIIQKDMSTSGKSSGSSNTGSGTNTGVVAIMDSMEQLKRSQRIGKITSSVVNELKSMSIEGYSENGKIKIIMDGQQNIINIYIDENYYYNNNNNNKDKVELQELTNGILYAMKDARSKSVEKMNEKMKHVYNELGFYTLQ